RCPEIYKDCILEPIDLADLWREILPFGVSGRLIFFSTYFSKSDIESMVFVVYNTVLACEKYKIEVATKYFADGYKAEEIEGFFLNNNRYRIKEKCKRGKFNKIVTRSKVTKEPVVKI
ncbi:MAG TPA: hypothetical protein GX707_13205, partial [Epulopiscium sp.]|nr:hypothetical protein [Candidatus Epulonipiscium sp.]